MLFHKGRELYGLHEARQALRNIERLVVVEGYMDVVALARHGIDFAVGTLGTATTPEHLNRLFRLTDNVDFCFDGDRAGKQAAWRALETALPLIREGRQVRFAFLPDKHDPDSYVNEFGADAFVAALDGGVKLADYLIGELASDVDLGSVDGRARLAERARPLIGKVPEGVYRELLLDSLAAAVGLSADKLKQLLKPGRDNDAGRDKPRPLANIRRIGSHGGPSVIRRAVTLLLNNPAGGRELDGSALEELERPGAPLLKKLIETVQSEPNITTAGLLERWRHDDEGRYLGKLAAANIPADEADFDAAAELAQCLDQLKLVARKDRIDFLIQKQRDSSLSEDELAELRGLR